jgi:hypothetical protein
MVIGVPRDEASGPVPETAKDLMAAIDAAHRIATERIAAITPEQLAAMVSTRSSRQLSGADAMVESFAHAFRHVGSILDARHLGGFETHALG